MLAVPFFALVIAAGFLVVGGNLAGASMPAACHHQIIKAERLPSL